MASVKIASLVIRTLAKPIANTIKSQAAEHESFRNLCIGLAQNMHRTEARLRMGLLNEEAKNIKPLNDTRAVQNGATTLAETFLFVVAAGLVLGETYRSNKKEGKRRDDVQERLQGLEEDAKSIRGLLENGGVWTEALQDLRERNDNLERVLGTVVNNGLRAGWLSLGHGDGLEETLPFLDQSSRTQGSQGRQRQSESQILAELAKSSIPLSPSTPPRPETRLSSDADADATGSTVETSPLTSMQ